MAIYMKMDGIDGEVTTKGFEKWIEVQDAAFSGISSHVTTRLGRNEDRVLGLPAFGDMTLVKPADTSSIKLFEHAYSQTVIPKVTISYVTTGTIPETYSKYELQQVLVSHYSEHKNEHNHSAVEHLTLNFETIQKTFIPRTSNNKLGSPLVSGYNLPQAEKM